MVKIVTPQVQFEKLEKEVLADWEQENIFQKQDESRKEAPLYSFYDGPPFANGLPHYGHLLANTIKDTVPRYWIMRGFRVNRRFGWDCHGLPVEFEIEKKHKLKGKPDILKLGVDKFNESCRESVLHYVNEWKKTITRLGRWVKWDDQYRTMDLEFMESVWWVFSELHKKGLIYQDFKVVPYSPRTASVVSNFEANQNYKQVQDPSVIVKFKAKEFENTWFVVWTTTPWTLPSNLCLAVHKDIRYVKLKDKESGEFRIVAEKRIEFLYPVKKSEEAPYEIVETFPGKDLQGQAYEPMFDYFAKNNNSFMLTCADFVNVEDGTGVVHQAPAYGEDDFYTCKSLQIDLVDPINESGMFDQQTPDLEGTYFKDADKIICKKLKEKNLLIRHDTLVHSYPFDERTDTPLMYKAVPSWYVAVEKFAKNLVDNNQKINWVPDHIKDGRMGTWLQNVRDWSISRNRFWGTPLPVWVCEQESSHKIVISSVKDLEKRAQQAIKDLHKHYIDKVTFSCEHCGGVMKNAGVVFDCWFESGSMPYAQLHYPFANKKTFDEVFPADFVAEGLDQTRGWFYTLNVLSNALFEKPAFKNVIVNGVILDETGKKMSKRHRNYTPPDELIDKYGADSIRLYMLNSSLLKADDLIFSDKGVHDIARQVLLPLWNAYSFLSTYAKADGWLPSKKLAEGIFLDPKNDLDRWIVSRLNTLKSSIAKHMEAYKLYLVVTELINFIEDLTNWYIRLSRRRFWGDSTSQDKKITAEQDAAYTTLFYVLLDFSKLFAPFAPFVSDKIYKNLTEGLDGVLESVHLCDMPQAETKSIDQDLEYYMDLSRKAISQGRYLRQKHKLKIRQILPSLTVVVGKAKDKELMQRGVSFIKSELNVKEVFFSTSEADHVKLLLRPNLKVLGKKLGKDVNKLRLELEVINKDQSKVVKVLQAVEQKKEVTLSNYQLSKEDLFITREPLDSQLVSSEGGVTVLLNTDVTPELRAEGWAREVVNRIQNLRKSSGLDVSDRIKLQCVAASSLAKAIEQHKAYIMSETLGVDLEILTSGEECNLKFIDSYDIENMTCVIALEVVNN